MQFPCRTSRPSLSWELFSLSVPMPLMHSHEQIYLLSLCLKSGESKELFNFKMWMSNLVVLCYKVLEGMQPCQVFLSADKASLT